MPERLAPWQQTTIVNGALLSVGLAVMSWCLIILTSGSRERVASAADGNALLDFVLFQAPVLTLTGGAVAALVFSALWFTLRSKIESRSIIGGRAVAWEEGN